jgi:2'-5' RNA ligase
MRCFLALRPTAADRDRLDEVQRRFLPWELPGRWTHREDLHVTALFLGELDDDEARLLPTVVEGVLAARPEPTRPWSLVGLGASGGRQWPQSVYVAVSDPTDWLADLHADLADACDGALDPAYRPHVTIVRPRGAGRPGRDWPELLAGHGELQLGPCSFESVGLFVSEARDSGPRYRALATWALPH